MPRKSLSVWKLRVTKPTQQRFVELADLYYIPIGEVVRRVLVLYEMVERNTGDGAMSLVRDAGLWKPPTEYDDA